MLIGIPKEIKDNEARVALSPLGIKDLTSLGNKIYVTKNAGINIGYSDEDYIKAGAIITENNQHTYASAELIVKVKEPQLEEIELLKKDQIIFSYLHLAAEKNLTLALLKKQIIAIAYETITENNNLPLLQPMSEVAGRLSVQCGALALQKNFGGKGILLGGVSGVEPGKVTIIGGGTAGTNAAYIANGMGADVTIIEKSLIRIKELHNIFNNHVKILSANQQTIEKYVTDTDLLIGAVLVPGTKAPKIITKETVYKMKPGSVIVDISIDQGGCIATSKPTTHSNPIYEDHGILHYCVTNIPAIAAKTATRALENATLPYIIALSTKGYKKSLQENKGFLAGLNIFYDTITYKSVADAFSLDYTASEQILSI